MNTIELTDVRVNGVSITLADPLILTIEKGDNGMYTLYDDETFGILATAQEIDDAVDIAKREFTTLWNEYVHSQHPLTQSGMQLRERLMSIVLNGTVNFD